MNRLSILVLAVAAAAFGHSTDAWGFCGGLTPLVEFEWCSLWGQSLAVVIDGGSVPAKLGEG